MVSGTAALLLDPLSGGRGPRIRDAVRTVLGADVTAVAYSHAHRDHAGDAAELVSTARERGGRARGPRLRRPAPALAGEATAVFGHTADAPEPRRAAEGPRTLPRLVSDPDPVTALLTNSSSTSTARRWTASTSMTGAGCGRSPGWTSICELLDWLADDWDQPEEGIWETRGGARTSPTAS